MSRSRQVCLGCSSPHHHRAMYSLKDEVWLCYFHNGDMYCLTCAEEEAGRPFELDEFDWCPTTVQKLVSMGRASPDEAAARGIAFIHHKLTSAAERLRLSNPVQRLQLLQEALVEGMHRLILHGVKCEQKPRTSGAAVENASQ